MASRCVVLLVIVAALVLPVNAPAANDPETTKVMEKYKPNIDKGLQWLAKAQARDGHWEGQGGTYPIAMTALAGMALLAEGSTPSQGKYAKEIDNAVEYLLSRVQRDTGQIGNPRDPRESGQYMYGHGFSTMFLAQVYGEENDPKRRRELKRVLEKAVVFIGHAQTKLGGWGYISARDSGDFDEGSVTITQVQALRAARDVGVQVPKEIIDKAHDYLKKSTRTAAPNSNPMKEEAGVIYSLRSGGSDVRPALTAAGVACLFNAGEYKSELAVKWINYCQRQIPYDRAGQGRFGHDEYTLYYLSQVVYALGEDRHAELRPDLAEEEKRNPGKKVLIKWSRYREVMFDSLVRTQSADGSWNSGSVGPVYTTALYLTILQLDKAALPIYNR